MQRINILRKQTILALFFLFLSLHSSLTHQLTKTVATKKSVHGAINEYLRVPLPKSIDRVFAVKTQNKNDQKYISTRPAGINLLKESEILIVPSHSETILQSLRNYHSLKYRDMLVFDGSVIMHEHPNIIISYRQEVLTNQMKLSHTYTLPDLDSRQQTKIYRYGPQLQEHQQFLPMFTEQKAGLMVINNNNFMYKIQLNQFKKLQLQNIVAIAHLQFINSNTFIAAQFSLGVSVYEISEQQNKIKKVSNYNCLDLQISKQQQFGCYITDITYHHTMKQLFVLDQRSGLYKYNLTLNKNKDNYTISGHQRLVNATKCQSMDMVSTEHFVLICQLEMPSYILEVVRMKQAVTGKDIYVQKDPIYHTCDFKDLLVTEDFYLTFGNFQIDIFWNSIRNGRLQTQHTKQHINLPGMEIFTLKNNPMTRNMELYVAESHILTKYQLIIYNGGVYVRSQSPINKIITLQIEGPCEQKLSPTNNGQYPMVSCIYEQEVYMKILQHQQSNRHTLSISLGIIILMLVILVILICICIMKYMSMQKFMREVLSKQRAANKNIKQISI